MDDDFASKEDTPNTATEVDEINTWNETTMDDPIEAEILAEVNKVCHKYGRYPSHCGYWNTGPRSQIPEHCSEEAKATTSHLHQDTTTPDTRTLQWHTKPTHSMVPHQMPT